MRRALESLSYPLSLKHAWAMNLEKQPLVTYERVEFEKYLVEVQDLGTLPIILEEFMQYISDE